MTDDEKESAVVQILQEHVGELVTLDLLKEIQDQLFAKTGERSIVTYQDDGCLVAEFPAFAVKIPPGEVVRLCAK